MRRLELTALALVCSTLGCGGPSEPPPAEVPAPAAPMSMMAHGDHSPHHGGTVWMHGDLHFEVVLDPGGEHRVYFTDEVRMELPAAVASDVSITVLRSDAEPEPLTLSIDEYGESWIAEGAPVEDPANARALVSFSHESGPYEIDVPFVAAPPDPDAPDPHRMP